MDAAVKRGRFKTIGIIGTRMMMETRLYGAISSATAVVPLGAELDDVHESYAAIATAGRVSDVKAAISSAKYPPASIDRTTAALCAPLHVVRSDAW